jgi:heme-degrading monooxygenase HmoA
MFARVITAQTGPQGVDDVVALASRQLSAGRRRPGFEGFYLLTDPDGGAVTTISLWATREDMDAVSGDTADGIHDAGVAATGLASPRLATYEVALHVPPPSDET